MTTSTRIALLGILVAAGLVATGCGRRAGRTGWFGWAAVPACQNAIRARALSEFGHKADVDFEGVADERTIDKRRVRVTGRATVERKGGDIKLTYECVANTRTDRLESASYHAAE
jgi:hypothetical protein